MVIGTAMTAEDNKVYPLQFDPKEKRSGYYYGLLKKLVEVGFFEDAGYAASSKGVGGGPCHFYKLTDKGRRFGLEYGARAIAANPRLIPLEEFV